MQRPRPEKKELLNQQKIQKQRHFTYALIAGFFALLAFVLVILRSRQKQRQANKLLAEQNEAISQQKEQLQELDLMKSRFFTNISHEFRTPLTVISGMAQQIKKSPQKWLERGIPLIERSSNNLLNLVSQILDLRKLESGTLKLNMIQGDIINYLRYILESFHSLAEDKGLTLHFLNEEEAFIMDYDQEKLTRIVSNLLSNAIKFTSKGGNVYLTVGMEQLADDNQERSANEQLVIMVKDTGIGIPDGKLPHIFDRFYQVDDTRQGKGTGIGLALSRELVKLMEGSIEVESEVGTGSVFKVLLPIRKEAGREEAEISEDLSPLSAEKQDFPEPS